MRARSSASAEPRQPSVDGLGRCFLGGFSGVGVSPSVRLPASGRLRLRRRRGPAELARGMARSMDRLTFFASPRPLKTGSGRCSPVRSRSTTLRPGFTNRARELNADADEQEASTLPGQSDCPLVSYHKRNISKRCTGAVDLFRASATNVLASPAPPALLAAILSAGTLGASRCGSCPRSATPARIRSSTGWPVRSWMRRYWRNILDVDDRRRLRCARLGFP